jgi:hypothetical protein
MFEKELQDIENALFELENYCIIADKFVGEMCNREINVNQKIYKSMIDSCTKFKERLKNEDL